MVGVVDHTVQKSTLKPWHLVCYFVTVSQTRRRVWGQSVLDPTVLACDLRVQYSERAVLYLMAESHGQPRQTGTGAKMNESGSEADDPGDPHAAHLRMLTTLAEGVTHEFNNLLAAVGGFAQIGLDNLDNPELVQTALTRCAHAATRGVEVVRRMSHFAVRDEPDWEIGDAGDVIRDITDLVRVACEHDGIRLVIQAGEMPPLRYDPALLAAALMELLQNAIEALREADQQPKEIHLRTATADGDGVIRIVDNGPGWPGSVRERLGVPFVTTKGPLAHGAFPEAKGLGIAAALGMIERLGGCLVLDTPAAGGAEARVILPAYQRVERVGKGRVLVVDDEAVIRRLFCRFLDRAGFRAVAAPSAIDGLALLADSGEDPFDLILLDQMMPGMSGIEMLEAMEQRPLPLPLPPVVMITADYSNQLARKSVAAGAVACLSKPINHDRVLYYAALHCGREGLAATLSSQTARSRPRRVLLVNPDALAGEALEAVLRGIGYRVNRVADRVAAVRASEEEYFDLVLMDVLLHDGTGPTAVRQIRLNNPFTPILIVTPQLSRQTLREAIRQGATQAVRHPLNIQGLVDEVERIAALFDDSL